MILVGMTSFCSCDIGNDEKEEMPQDKATPSSESSTSKADEDDNYTFSFTSISPMQIKTDAGKEEIYFDCNHPWKITCNGNVTGLSASPESGEGKGVVTIYFLEAQYKYSQSSYSWDESEDINFIIREGKKGEWHETTKSFKVYRRGSKIIP